MNTIFCLLSVQAVLGAFDNLWHHEWEAKLPQRVSARYELALHAAREAIYGVVFIGLGWLEWRGAWAYLLAALLLTELGITLADFLEEDRTRRLPPFERALHTVLTICYGLFLGLFAPIWVSWASEPSALQWTPQGWVSWLFTAYGLGVLAWSLRNTLAVLHLARLAQSAPQVPPALHGHRIAPAVLVTGATGFLGKALLANLLRDGHRVIVLSRDARQAQALFGAGVWVVEHLDAIPSETRIDAVVNLAGARVLGKPWTTSRRRELLASRVNVGAALLDLLRRLQQTPRVLVTASAVGYYGAPPHAWHTAQDESAPPRPGEFQSDLCAAVEHEARRAESLGVRVIRMRFGVVLGHGDGAYPMLASGARWGMGSVLGSGQQPAPWIHLHDAIGLIRFALSNGQLQGAVNAVAEETLLQTQFAEQISASFGKRVLLRVPAPLMRVLLGEMATLLLDGQNVKPQAAVTAGYKFRFPTLAGALQDLAHTVA